jgi:hypothetical protein
MYLQKKNHILVKIFFFNIAVNIFITATSNT